MKLERRELGELGCGFNVLRLFLWDVTYMADKEPGLDNRIWQVVASIPPGRVATYGDIAQLAGLSRAARRVGRALRKLPPDTRIPWHRVINAQGRISLPDGSASQYTQRERLEAEGVVFRANKSIDLRRFRWCPEEDGRAG